MNNLKSVIDRDTAITLDQKYPKKLCNEIISFIDNYKSKDTEMNYGNSEIRIWDAHKKNKLILDFKIKSDTLLSNIYNKKIRGHKKRQLSCCGSSMHDKITRIVVLR